MVQDIRSNSVVWKMIQKMPTKLFLALIMKKHIVGF
jgi:hypothetical protein